MTRLPDLDDDDIYVHSATQLTTPRAPNATYRFNQNKSARYPPRPEVHVTTDQIVMEDFKCVIPSLIRHSLCSDAKFLFLLDRTIALARLPP